MEVGCSFGDPALKTLSAEARKAFDADAMRALGIPGDGSPSATLLGHRMPMDWFWNRYRLLVPVLCVGMAARGIRTPLRIDTMQTFRYRPCEWMPFDRDAYLHGLFLVRPRSSDGEAQVNADAMIEAFDALVVDAGMLSLFPERWPDNVLKRHSWMLFGDVPDGVRVGHPVDVWDPRYRLGEILTPSTGTPG
ncbi:hypothetical protein J2847_002973 [Azospirillum agricola]|uniref:hypothetical protein n=1 Tax=Azospirillum agricola TaxID=1720247 RepID=UPI001AE25A88|nr:hypothetical protein [Azospirillum agricola]MBP2229674.1 hypothetical protein [Azospirillum agricola]